jgi:hypothetical protein
LKSIQRFCTSAANRSFSERDMYLLLSPPEHSSVAGGERGAIMVQRLEGRRDEKIERKKGSSAEFVGKFIENCL